MEGVENPLSLCLNHGGHQSYMELRLVQLRDSLSSPPPLSMGVGNGRGKGGSAEDSDDSEEMLPPEDNPTLNPKEEGNDFRSQPKPAENCPKNGSSYTIPLSPPSLPLSSLSNPLVIDHGIAQIEIMMEEALQDIPPLVHDIQERLKGISESVAVDGKPRSGLPSRRLLWDRLKPQASAVSRSLYAMC